MHGPMNVKFAAYGSALCSSVLISVMASHV